MGITREELYTRLAALPEPMLIDAVIDALAAAGGEPEWDSETVENVILPFQDVVSKAGMPWVGATSNDVEDVNAWRRMTPDEWAELCPECWEEGHDCTADEDDDDNEEDDS